MDWLFIIVYGAAIGIVVEIAAALLIMTGLNRDIARFQAVSMLTATGFTTKESELVLRHPFRRRIAIFLILFGVFSLAVIISTLSNIFTKSFRLYELFWVTAVLAAFLIVLKNKRMGAYLTRKTEHHLEKVFELHELPIHEVLYINGSSDLLAEVQIRHNSHFIGQAVSEIGKRLSDINILYIQRGTEKSRQFDSQIEEGDKLFVYGNKQEIEEVFKAELEEKQPKQVNEHEMTSLD